MECLESVLRNDYPNYQVIVVDNNSPNNSYGVYKGMGRGKTGGLSAFCTFPQSPLRKYQTSLVLKV